MKRVLDAMEILEQQSAQQVEHIKQRNQQGCDQLEKNWQVLLRTNKQRIEKDIHAQSTELLAQHARLRSLTLTTWLWVVITLIGFLMLSWGALWWQGKTITDNLRQIQQQERTLAKLQQQTFGIELHQENQRIVAIPTRLIIDQWTGTNSNGEYQVIQLKE